MTPRALQYGRCLFLGLFLTLPAHAEENINPEMAQAEYEAANQDAMKAALTGPTDIAISDQGYLLLPEGMAYIPKTQTQRLLQAIDGHGDSSVEGGVVEIGRAHV